MRILNTKELSAINGGSPLLYAAAWGATLGVVGYTVSNKNNFYSSGFLLAGVSAGLNALLDPYGGAGQCLQVLNVAFFAEIISAIQAGQ